MNFFGARLAAGLFLFLFTAFLLGWMVDNRAGGIVTVLVALTLLVEALFLINFVTTEK